MDQDLLTVGEASELLRLKPSTVRAWLLKRRIPFIKLGSRVFLRKKDCLQLIETNTVKPSEPLKHSDQGGRVFADWLLGVVGEGFPVVAGGARDG